MAKELRGVYTVMITPMKDDFQIDEKGFRDNIDWQISKGIAGICVVGSTGEFVSLTKEERNRVAKIAVEHAAGRVPVIVGTAAATTMEVIEYTKYAESIGADAAMIINPYYSLPSQEEVIEFFRMVGEAVNIPIMAYNNPAVSGVDVLPETFKEIGKIKNIEYLKDASGEIRRVRSIQEYTEGKVKVFNGSEDICMESFILGAVGWICVAGNAAPAECQQIFDLVQKGDIEGAKKVENQIMPLLRYLESHALVQSAKAITAKVGCAAGPARYPRLPLPKDQDEELDLALKQSGIVK